MKRSIIFSVIVIVIGLFIALGPQFLFKVCAYTVTTDGTVEDCCDTTDNAAGDTADGSCGCSGGVTYSVCHWTARAEIGMGLLIAALGACMIVFTDPKTHLGLIIGVFMASFIALGIPHFLIGGCGSLAMRCRRVAFPALTIESVILLVFSAIMLTVITMRKTQTMHE